MRNVVSGWWPLWYSLRSFNPKAFMTDELNHAGYTQGPVGKHMLTMGLHMLVGHLAIMAFNFTDTFFVSRLGETSLAAMSFVRPLAMFGFNVMFGLGIGAAAVLSKVVGRGDGHRLRRLATDCLLLALTLGILLALIGGIVAKPLFIAMGARDEALSLALRYVAVWLFAFPIACLPMVMNNAIRANGDTRTPALIMSISAGVNIILDPIFIFGTADLHLLGGVGETIQQWLAGIGVPMFHGMGMVGAAVATVVSRMLSTAAAMSIIHFRLRLLRFDWPGVRTVLNSWAQLLRIGAPAAGMTLLNPISMFVMTGLVARFGESAVAAMSPGGMIEFMAMVPIFSLASVLLPFTGQNAGARRYDRIATALRYCFGFAILWGAGSAVLLMAGRGGVASIFLERGLQARGYLEAYLTWVPIGFVFFGWIVMSANALNALHKPLLSTFVNVLRTLVFMIPLGYVGRHVLGAKGVFIGMALANVPVGIFAVWLLAKTLARARAGEVDAQGPVIEAPGWEQAPSGDE